jgi:hypothetical protein
VEENDYAENTLDWRNLGRSSAVCDYSGFGQVVGATFGRSGGLAPISLPLFQGVRLLAGEQVSSSGMVVLLC